MRLIDADNEKFVEMFNRIFKSGVAYGMALQMKDDAKDWNIIDEKTGKLLFEDYSAYELASVFYPEIVKSLFL